MALFNYEREKNWLVTMANGSFKHYRSTLSVEDKFNYDLLFDAILNFEPFVIGFRGTPKKLSDILHFVLRDNPIFYYTKPTYRYGGDGYNWKVEFDYSMSQFSALRVARVIMKRLEEYKTACRGKSNLEAIRYVHDDLAKNVEYDLHTTDPYQAYSVFTVKRAVCEGIAEATKLIMDCLGIRCIIATGQSRHPGESSNVNHAWNMVDIGRGVFYHLDVTFDNGVSKGTGTVLHNYYLLTDEQIRETHIVDELYKSTPTKKIDFFTTEDRCYTSFATFERAIAKSIARREKTLYYQLDVGVGNQQEIEKSLEIIQNVLRSQNVGANYKINYDIVKRIVYVDFSYHN